MTEKAIFLWNEMDFSLFVGFLFFFYAKMTTGTTVPMVPPLLYTSLATKKLQELDRCPSYDFLSPSTKYRINLCWFYEYLEKDTLNHSCRLFSSKLSQMLLLEHFFAFEGTWHQTWWVLWRLLGDVHFFAILFKILENACSLFLKLWSSMIISSVNVY